MNTNMFTYLNTTKYKIVIYLNKEFKIISPGEKLVSENPIPDLNRFLVDDTPEIKPKRGRK